MHAICVKFGASQDAVKARLLKLGVRVRDKSEAKACSHYVPSEAHVEAIRLRGIRSRGKARAMPLRIPEFCEIGSMYADQRLSVLEIATRLGISRGAVYIRLKKLGIDSVELNAHLKEFGRGILTAHARPGV
jgi:hypothetical protein